MSCFIQDYMRSKTREHIDKGQAYVATMEAQELWNFFCKTENYKPVKGSSIKGFAADWIGQFYAYFQWYYNVSSKKVLELVPLEFIRAAYNGLHDLELELAVQKVGGQIGM